MWHMPKVSLLVVLVLLLQIVVVSAKNFGGFSGTVRTYYIAAQDEEWDFAPSGRNLINDEVDVSDRFLQASRDPPKIGRKYKKAIYREYTDASFRHRVPPPEWLGLLGPVIKAEVGDKLIVHFFNNASRNYSIHPHGVLYSKLDEGALYVDGTTLREKMDDGVPPGATYVYEWDAIPKFGPTADDPNCLTWAYHSHFMAENDINTGVTGILVICRPGILDPWGKRRDVDKEFALVFMVNNENLNFYLEDNIRTYLPGLDPEKVIADPEFEMSNVMFGINGLVFGNLQGLDMCAGDRVSWYLLGLGSQRDIHSVNFQGQTIIEYKQRKSIVNLFPAISTTVSMVADNPGSWMLSCRVDFHFQNGMKALFNVDTCGHPLPDTYTSGGKVREHFIAAEEVIWDYAPSGLNLLKNVPLTEDEDAKEFFTESHNRIGGKYKKVIYRGYTDNTFLKPLRHPRYLGILGPIIRAEVGDVVKVVFLNRASRPYTIEPYRFFMDKNNEAFEYHDGENRTNRLAVPPEQRYTYIWPVPYTVGPTKVDPQCLTGRYYSTVDFVRDAFSGLLGPLLLCRKGSLDEHGRQMHVDDEYFINFFVFDENLSHYFEENVEMFLGNSHEVDLEEPRFVESNHMHAINGYLYGNVQGLVMCKESIVSWHIMGVGDDPDVHGIHFHGNTFSVRHQNKDTLWFIPDTFETLIMKPDNVGEWLVECRTNIHFQTGMRATYHVKGCNTKETEIPITGKIRTYYIGAIEEEWNFAPKDIEMIFGGKLSEDETASIFVNQNDTQIGRRYKKALFREFEDASFTKQKKRRHDEIHLSMLGPFIKAEVGDVIQVFFKNMASRNYSIHPHGVFYHKADEGSPYDDGTTGEKKLDDEVSPGHVYEYIWAVPKRAGPGENDFPCNTWAYYSAVNTPKDTNSGLVGPLITCRPGTLGDDGRRKDIDREFALLFSIIDENESWYLKQNIERYTFRPDLVDTENPGFEESNLKRAINGRIFGNVEGLDMNLGDHVAFYLMGLGSEADVHTVHLHGQTFVRQIVGSNRHDVIELLPGTYSTIELEAVDPGEWFLHCHVNEHSEAGMGVIFTVHDPSAPPQTRGQSITIPKMKMPHLLHKDRTRHMPYGSYYQYMHPRLRSHSSNRFLDKDNFLSVR